MRVIHGIARPLQGMNDSMTEDEFSMLFRQTAGRLHAYAARQVGRPRASQESDDSSVTFVTFVTFVTPVTGL